MDGMTDVNAVEADRAAPPPQEERRSALTKGYRREPYSIRIPAETPPQAVIDICDQLAEWARQTAAEARANLNQQRMQAARLRVLNEKSGDPRDDYFLKAGERARALRLDGDPDPCHTAALEFSIPKETVRWWERTANRIASEQARAERDREIARLVAAGWSNPQIARKLNISKSTIGRVTARQFRARTHKGLFDE